jgi:hypothetical protein
MVWSQLVGPPAHAADLDPPDFTSLGLKALRAFAQHSFPTLRHTYPLYLAPTNVHLIYSYGGPKAISKMQKRSPRL